MGDRGQVYMKNSGVYLYTHFGAYSLIKDVQSTLSKKLRWDDEEYLTRMIFSDLIKDDIDGELGFGIGTQPHSDVWRFVIVDVEKQTITVKDNGKIRLKHIPFEKFIGMDIKEDE